MKKQILSLVALAALIQGATTFAREMRAPLPFRNGFQRFEHYPYICEDLDKCWNFDVWGGAFHRQANDAFTHGTNRETLAGLYFGDDSFSLSELFPVGTVVPPEFNFVLTPRFNYAENGAMFGFNVNHSFDCGNWDVGMRTNIPFITQTVTLENCCDLVETISNVVTTVVVRGINNPAPELVANPADVLIPVENSFAYRLDFLSSLFQVMNPTPAQIANHSKDLVKYSVPIAGANHVTINDKVVDESNINNPNPIHVVRVPVGTTPALPYSMRLVNGVDMLPGILADGSVPFGDRARFLSTTDYATGADALATNKPNQRRLWVVPTDDGSPFAITNDALAIRSFVTPFLQNEIAQTIQTLTSPIDFLRARGITFNTQNLTGAGDLDVDFYARRNFCSECHGDWYVEGITGLRFPTGKRVSDPGLLLNQPLGNNRHFEWKLGGQIGTQPCDWFAFKADAQFYHVFSRTERVAASFTGSTIRNIGPTVDAKVSWNYFLGNVDLTFVVPCTKNCSGFDIGYQPYFKLNDKVRFDQVTAQDLLGNVATLDPEVLENDTNRHAHRMKIELFHKTCNWEIYGGWLHTIAGKNIQRETDWYLGFGLFF